MKRGIISLLLLLCLLLTLGCSKKEGNNGLLFEGRVSGVEVYSMPHGYEYSFAGEKAERVADYIRLLTLSTEFEEDPDVFTGMTWVVELSYENGETLTVYMFGNMFIRRADSEWLKMDYDEAEQFSTLLEKLK